MMRRIKGIMRHQGKGDRRLIVLFSWCVFHMLGCPVQRPQPRFAPLSSTPIEPISPKKGSIGARCQRFDTASMPFAMTHGTERLFVRQC